MPKIRTYLNLVVLIAPLALPGVVGAQDAIRNEAIPASVLQTEKFPEVPPQKKQESGEAQKPELSVIYLDAESGINSDRGEAESTSTDSSDSKTKDGANLSVPSVTAPAPGWATSNSKSFDSPYSFQTDGIPTFQQRREIRAMPIESRPYRPGHFYGNAVRRDR